MVGMLDRKLARELKSTGVMLAAIISIVAVGVMCFIYMRSAHHNSPASENPFTIASAVAAIMRTVARPVLPPGRCSLRRALLPQGVAFFVGWG